MTFTHIDHCSVLITDVAAARQFYGDVLGLREIPPPREFDFVALWYDLGNSYLHLLLKPVADTRGPRHFCLHTPDAGMARQQLHERGVAIDDTVTIAAAERFFIRDPDGNRIEILQWRRPYNPDTDGKMAV